MANRPHYGRGLKFPIVGQFQPESGIDKIIEDIQLLLLTDFGERVMRPGYGSGITTRIWGNLDTVAEEAIPDIESAIREFEPRVNLIEVVPTIDRALGIIFFNIRFFVLEQNQEANLVFPFKPASEISQR